MTAPALPAARPQRVALAGALPAARAVELAARDAAPVVLTGDWAGVSAIVAGEPVLRGDADDPAASALGRSTPLLDGGDTVAVGGGWLGLIGYAAAAALTHPELAHPPVRERLPASILAYYDHVLVLDEDGQWWFESLWTEGRDADLARRAGLLQERLRRASTASAAVLPADATSGWAPEPRPTGHATAVEACRERIAAGDLYQANLALRLRARLHVPPAQLFSAGVTALAPERGAYLAGDWGAVASFSPELLLARRGETVVSQPIKGTRPRPAADAARADQLREELASSEKDRAENVMIVDLMRNDLGQVCVPGSVVADPVCEVQPMAGVWHLVSTVRGTLPPGVGDDTLAAAVLPAGSVTGAPKRAALATIAELESAERQAFCGSVVLASPVSGLEMSVVIRTLECAGDAVWLDVGGGVTAASDPEAEAAECLAKAEPVLRAIGGVLPASPAAATAPEPLRLGPVPLPRPDPAEGIITTLRADDGRAEHLAEHLTRLKRSSRAVYGHHLPDHLGREVRDTAARTLAPQRIRITAHPDGRTDVEAWTIDAPELPISLEPVCLPGGLGAHKWADRRLVNALEQHTAPAEPLLCDLDGSVLETSRWALIAELDGVLVTPPADGRILPSLGIATLHAALRPEPRVLTLEDLARASDVYVINAVRGMVPVTEVAGVWERGR